MDYSKYENKLEYPRKVSRKCSSCGKSFKLDDNFCSECGNNIKDEFEFRKQKYKEDLISYNKEQCRIEDLFKEDALKAVCLNEHPKKDIIYYKAYEDGHAYGYSGIMNCLDDLASFIYELEN